MTAGSNFALRLFHQHLERHLVTGTLGEALGKRVVELEDVARTLAAQLVVELGHHDARAHLVEIVGGREPFDRLVVHVALDVDLGVVAVGERRGRVFELGEAVAQRVDLPVDGLVLDDRAGDLDLERVVPDDGDLRAHLDDGVELDVAVVLAGGDIDLGRRDHVDVLGLDRLDVVLGQGVAQGLIARRLGAEARLQQLAGRLAGPEPGQLHLVGELAERSVDRTLEIGRGDRDVELDLVAFEGLNGRRDGHGGRHSIRRRSS